MPNKLVSFLLIGISIIGCTNNLPDAPTEKKLIAAMLDSFNVAAAKSDYNKYFNYFTEDAIFIGTDATENWDKKKFQVWAKPYFDKGTT